MQAIICNKCKKIISTGNKDYFHGVIRLCAPDGRCLGESEYDICSECFELIKEFLTDTNRCKD